MVCLLILTNKSINIVHIMAKDKSANAVGLIGSPEKLINLIIKGSDNRNWALDAILLQGPPHKQIQHNLVLKRLEKLAVLIKKNTGSALKFAAGKSLSLHSTEGETSLPVSIPAKSMENLINAGDVIEKLTKGPAHEVLYTAILLQYIEAMIAVQENKTT
jgi:hypothetical protein